MMNTMIDVVKFKRRVLMAKLSKQKSFVRKLARDKAVRESSVNHYLSLIRFSNRSGSHTGCFRAFMSESDEHITEKFVKWLELRRRGHEVICEPIFIKDQVRMDLLDLTDGICYEILENETKDEFMEKIKGYPIEFAYESIQVKKE